MPEPEAAAPGPVDPPDAPAAPPDAPPAPPPPWAIASAGTPARKHATAMASILFIRRGSRPNRPLRSQRLPISCVPHPETLSYRHVALRCLARSWVGERD